MCFVDNDSVVISQQRIAMYFSEQNPIRHQFYTGIRRHFVVEAHLESHHTAQLGLEFMGDACGDGTRRHTTRLRMPNATQDPTP